MKSAILFLIIILGLLSACAPAASPTATNQPAATAAAPGKESDQLMIHYKSSGGIAGKINEIAIYADGRIVTSEAGERQVDPALVTQLLADIQAAGFLELKESYGALAMCNDCMSYEISVNDGGKMKKITTNDAAKDTPPEFWQIAEKINQLATR
jgi:hypothetical protein